MMRARHSIQLHDVTDGDLDSIKVSDLLLASTGEDFVSVDVAGLTIAGTLDDVTAVAHRIVQELAAAKAGRLDPTAGQEDDPARAVALADGTIRIETAAGRDVGQLDMAEWADALTIDDRIDFHDGDQLLIEVSGTGWRLITVDPPAGDLNDWQLVVPLVLR